MNFEFLSYGLVNINKLPSIFCTHQFEIRTGGLFGCMSSTAVTRSLRRGPGSQGSYNCGLYFDAYR